MTKHIAILRGINVGGNRKILMADLKALFEHLGFNQVASYIQSGNIIFESKKRNTNIELSEIIEKAIFNKFGIAVPVIVISANELEEIVLQNPYYQSNDVDIDRLHLTFLSEKPIHDNVVKVENNFDSPDKFVIIGKSIFLYCAGKYNETKFTNNFFESKLKVNATTRNWKTVIKLYELTQN